jgi:hypothetical protein
MATVYQAGNYIEFIDDMFDGCGEPLDLSPAVDVVIKLELEDVYFLTITGSIDDTVINRARALVTTIPDTEDAEGTWKWQFFITMPSSEVVRGMPHKIRIKANVIDD